MREEFIKAQELTSPNPFCLVTSIKKEDGLTNIMALSWWTYVSNRPPTIAICVSNKGYTNELVKECREFGLSVVDGSLKNKAIKCGTSSGRDINKVDTYGIELMDSVEIAPKLVRAHRVAFECAVIDYVTVHDHTIFIGEVKRVHLNPNVSQLFAFGGYKRLDTIGEIV